MARRRASSAAWSGPWRMVSSSTITSKPWRRSCQPRCAIGPRDEPGSRCAPPPSEAGSCPWSPHKLAAGTPPNEVSWRADGGRDERHAWPSRASIHAMSSDEIIPSSSKLKTRAARLPRSPVSRRSRSIGCAPRGASWTVKVARCLRGTSPAGVIECHVRPPGLSTAADPVGAALITARLSLKSRRAKRVTPYQRGAPSQVGRGATEARPRRGRGAAEKRTFTTKDLPTPAVPKILSRL